MFLPFLLALANCVLLGLPRLRARTGWSYAVWTGTVAVTIAWFFYHATDPLNFSF
jgi:multidrug transporter EmrE-like cation transporter